ncbi:hypothetical protein J6590_041702 [Homalodisca vitripennis]|nr:hypothetical protein J6590_041702 [Homalodisca vitripennis]
MALVALLSGVYILTAFVIGQTVIHVKEERMALRTNLDTVIVQMIHPRGGNFNVVQGYSGIHRRMGYFTKIVIGIWVGASFERNHHNNKGVMSP